MPEFVINDVTVQFPFDPYPIQKDFMERLINCLEHSQNAILESPTGTGKTVCLLSGTLAWVSHYQAKEAERAKNSDDDESKPKPIVVIYASRTHSQLDQAIKELKRSPYSSFFSATVIGSRDQLCIDPILKHKSNAEKTVGCKALKQKCACQYFKDMDSRKPELDTNITDIEDLRLIGKKQILCPYYLSRELAERSRVIFMPYNYLLDPSIRESALKDVNLKNAIVIIDEAHNVESVCEDGASTSITCSEIVIAIRDISSIHKKLLLFGHGQHGIDAKKADELKKSLQKFFISVYTKAPSLTRSGNFIFALLKEANITVSNCESKIDLIEKLLEFSFKQEGTPRGIGLKAILNFLQIVFANVKSRLKDRIDPCYNVYIENEPADTVQKPRWLPNNIEGANKIVNFWCFSAEFGIDSLMRKKIRSLVLTSGTLSPFKPTIAELGIPVPVQLSNKHIVKDFQVFATVVRSVVKNELLDGSYKNRSNEKYFETVGKSIVKIAEVTPDGLLIFFKSYEMMEKCQRLWRDHSIWERMEQLKPIFTEPRDKKSLPQVMTSYYTSINQAMGAIFMAVLKGKVSEGLDFIDMYGRTVVVVGIPFALFTDPKIKLKQQYLKDDRKFKKDLPNGKQWYDLQAIRAVNQAIGRVIRHQHDYGAILLFDKGFGESKNQKDLSRWIKDILRYSDQGYNMPFGAIMEDLTHFFKYAEEKLPKPKLKELREMSVMSDDVDEFDEPSYLQRIAEALADEYVPTDDDDDDPWDADFDEFKLDESDIEAQLAQSQVVIHERKRKSSGEAQDTDTADMLVNETSNDAEELKRLKKSEEENLELEFGTDSNMNFLFDELSSSF